MKENDLIAAGDPRLVKLPTSDPAVIAASVSALPTVIGAFVVVLNADGSIAMSMAGPDDAEVMKPLLDMKDAVESHIDAVRGTDDKVSSTGLPRHGSN